jgi:hypothetical protein
MYSVRTSRSSNYSKGQLRQYKINYICPNELISPDKTTRRAAF